MEYYPPQLLILQLLHMKTITEEYTWLARNGSYHDILSVNAYQAGDGRALTGRSVPGSWASPDGLLRLPA